MSYFNKSILKIFAPLIFSSLLYYDEIVSAIDKQPIIIVAIMSFIAVVAGLVLQRQSFIQNNTLEFERNLKHNEKLMQGMEQTIKFCKKYSLNKIESLAEDKIQGIISEFMELRPFLNEWERAAIALEKGLYDEKMLFEIQGGTVVYFWSNLAPLLVYRQRTNPKFYFHLMKLGIRWRNLKIQQEAKAKVFGTMLIESYWLSESIAQLVDEKEQLEHVVYRSNAQKDELYRIKVQMGEQLELLNKQLKEIERHCN